MAMVQILETEVTSRSNTEDDSHTSNHTDSSSRPSSRSSNKSKGSTPGPIPQYQYSREELFKISKHKLSRQRPEFLDPIHYNSSGRWDPERWFVNKRGDKPPPLEEAPRSKRERQETDVGISHKRRTSDPKERIKEDKGDIVLGPQRRSFGTGCHVIQQSTLARRPGSPTDGRGDESFRETRRIGSGRIMSRDREQRDWERDHRDYGYSSSRNDRRDRFDTDETDKEIRRYSNRYGRADRRMSRGHDRIEEEEPEWFSGGPTSQSETIELVGFDDSPNDEDRKRPNKKVKKSKDASRRQSLISDGDKSESSSSHLASPSQEESQSVKENPPLSESSKSRENSKPGSPELLKPAFETNDSKDAGANFDLDQLLRMDFMSDLLPETPPDSTSTEMGVSRFSQFFKRDSPILCVHGSGDSSRRSSIQDDIIAHVLGSIGEPHLIPSPPPMTENFFAPISPALSQSPSYCIPPPHPVNCSGNKNILEMLQAGSMGNSESIINGEISKMNGTDALEKAKTVKELEAGLKRMVLGNKMEAEDRSAFDKLVQHMTEVNSSPSPASISIGPIDKSKALQEEDLLQNILGRGPSPSQNACHSQMSHEDKSSSVPDHHVTGAIHPPFIHPQQQQPPQNDVFAQLLQRQRQQEQQQQLQAQQQRQMQQAQQQIQMQKQQQSQPGLNVQGITVDMLAKILGTQSSQPHMSPLSPGCQQSGSSQFFNNRNEPPTLSAMMQQQRQREILSSVLKQQQQPQQPPPPSVLTPSPVVQHRNQPSKDVGSGSVSQTTLGIPSMGTGLSPRQSPLPPDAIGSTIPGQGRIPSPLVFGQQPPALSHAPAPIHPAHLAQAIAQNATSSNTLQVQNALVLQRVPSPQELAVHTQSILQNALIKRKLEEQKENFRKRQEAQRTNSPVVSGAKNGVTSSPQKGISPIAFTPTSVMRKMHSEKSDSQQKIETQNGSSKLTEGSTENQSADLNQCVSKPSSTSVSTSIADSIFGNNTSNGETTQHISVGPRAVHGQGATNQPRLHQGMINPTHQVVPSQGRPIVKGNMQINVSGNVDVNRQPAGANKGVTPNKFVMQNSPQFHALHPEVSSGMDALNKLAEKQRLIHQQQAAIAAQRKLNSSPMAPLPAATFALGPRGPALSSHHPSLVRPVNIGPTTVGAPNINYPLLRMMQTNNAVRAAQTLNPLSHLGQLAALQQLQRGTGDTRQMQALAQNRNLHPLAFQQIIQNQVAVAQAQVAAGLAGVRGDGKHQHLVPGQPPTNRQSPVNLAKWFGNDVLKQKMPEMPAASHQKALLVEEVERQQQQSAAVHN